ncbi:MAG: GIY-YIG nuclease family protein [Anaerolineae bacterium]
MAVVYILECADGTLYTGWTTDLERRLRAHNSGRGARYTRGRRPLHLAYREKQPTRSAAQKREAAIRRLSRANKLKLIEGRWNGES